MRVGYVVLYVNDAEACRRFWVDQIGMVVKRRTEAGAFTIAQVGFSDQPFAFELVPLELMKDIEEAAAIIENASKGGFGKPRPTPGYWREVEKQVEAKREAD